MTLVIDANVFIAAARENEPHWVISLQFLRQVRAFGVSVHCPVILLPECSAGVARRTGRSDLALEVVAQVERFPNLQLVSANWDLAREATELAAEHLLRGADALYVAVAARSKIALVTWDQEVLQRAAAVVSVQTPAQWLQANSGPLGAGPT